MSMQADATYVEQYNSRLTHLYQPQGWLMQGLVMPESRIEGSKAYWPRMGRRTAKKKQRGVAATPDNPAFSQVSADLETWEAYTNVYTYDLARTNVNEREAQVQSGAMALGQAIDEEIMLLLDAAAPTSGTGYIDTSSGQLAPEQLGLMVAKWKDANNIPTDGQVWGGLTQLAHAMLMADKAYSSAEYNGPDLPFKANTTARTWNFINWVILPAEYFPVPSANKMDLFIWHKPNVGWTGDRRARAIIDWENDIGAWSIRQEADGAGIVIQDEAVARVRIKTDITSITTSL